MSMEAATSYARLAKEKARLELELNRVKAKLSDAHEELLNWFQQAALDRITLAIDVRRDGALKLSVLLGRDVVISLIALICSTRAQLSYPCSATKHGGCSRPAVDQPCPTPLSEACPWDRPRRKGRPYLLRMTCHLMISPRMRVEIDSVIQVPIFLHRRGGSGRGRLSYL